MYTLNRLIMTSDTLTPVQIAGLCDHTFLLPSEAYRHQVKKGESAVQLRRRAFEAFLEETISSPLKPYAVCVRHADVAFARQRLPDDIIIAATVGFPDGPACSLACKSLEAAIAHAEGATEIDMVMNYDALKNKCYDEVEWEIAGLVRSSKILKVILEISELTLEETAIACQIADRAGAAFVKTSTGFSAQGATVEHLQVMAANFPRGIKISGGVNAENVYELLRAAYQPLSTDPMKVRIGESTLLRQLTNGGL